MFRLSTSYPNSLMQKLVQLDSSFLFTPSALTGNCRIPAAFLDFSLASLLLQNELKFFLTKNKRLYLRH